MPTPPSIGKFTGTITWSDGSLFNGFAVIGLVFPTDDGVNWPSVTLEGTTGRVTIPAWATVPITDGVFNSQCGLYYNANINPPNTKYCIYYYDSAWKQVGAPGSSSDFFTVTTANFTPPTYTLTVPTAGTISPIPDTSVSGVPDYPRMPLYASPGGGDTVQGPSDVALYWDSVNQRFSVHVENATFPFEVGPAPASNFAHMGMIGPNAGIYLIGTLAPLDHRNWLIRTNNDPAYSQLFIESGNGVSGDVGFVLTWVETGDPLEFIHDAMLTVPTFIRTTTSLKLQFSDRAASGPAIHSDSVDPEGAVTASPGSIYLRTNGLVYRKASGSGNTGWEEIAGDPDAVTGASNLTTPGAVVLVGATGEVTQAVGVSVPSTNVIRADDGLGVGVNNPLSKGIASSGNTLLIRTIGAGDIRAGFDSGLTPFTIRSGGSVCLGPGNTSGTGTLHIQDTTATTGSTNVVVRVGAGQSGNLVEWQNSGGTAITYFTGTGMVIAPSATSGIQANHFATGISVGSTGGYHFTSGLPSSPVDLSFIRAASGLGEVNNGTAGQYRDLILRNLIGTLTTPASASAAGVAGTIVWDDNYIYVCVATNTWKRVAISTW